MIVIWAVAAEQITANADLPEISAASQSSLSETEQNQFWPVDQNCPFPRVSRSPWSEAWHSALGQAAQIAGTIRLRPDRASQWLPDCALAPDAHTWWSWKLSCAQLVPEPFAS